MKLHLKRPIAFFDLETTGTNVASDRIVEIAIIKIHPDGRIDKKPTEKGKENRFLINPTIKIPIESSLIHGIYDEDVKDKPTFKEVAKNLFKFIFDCDLAGFNSNKFDIPILAEEFLRCDIDFSIENRNLIDVQNIYHLMEKRTLKAGYKFYCGKDLVDAHEAMADTEATYEIFLAQLEKYDGEVVQDDVRKVKFKFESDIDKLHSISERTKNVDFLGRIILDSNNSEIFNFGKHKGKTVVQVLKEEPGYYSWMMQGDFPLYTKKVLTDLKNKM
jgi:DNA polymerase III subunit epsilon